MEVFDWMLNILHQQEIPVSDIMINLIEAVKNPATRNSQKWMADPLFKEIVTLISA